MPTNLYGPNDNYDLEKSHVLPALIRKMVLGNYLENNEWEGIRKNLDRNPIEKINGKSSEQDILSVLNKYGIFKNQNTVSIELWGSGKPRREFLHSNDLADACVFLMEQIDFTDLVKSNNSNEIKNTHINIGAGKDLTIAELADIVKKATSFKGKLSWNTEKPDGTFQKLLNVSKLHQLGWKEQISLEQGIEQCVKDYMG